MKMRTIVALLLVAVLLGGVGYAFRDNLRGWAIAANLMPESSEGAPSKPSSQATGEVTHIEAGAKGFSPDVVSLSSGDHVLEFTRKVNTCITSVVFSPGIGQFELPLNTPVRIPVSLKPGETISFTCPMEMYNGKVATLDQAAEGDPAHASHDPSETAYWSCSMHPSVRSATPGTCPICAMDLVPVTHGEIESGIITIDAQRRQLIGLRTGVVERRHLTSETSTSSVILPDETRLHDVVLRVDGFVGTLHADFVGKHVEKGEPLLTYYSPEAVAAQDEFLQSVRTGQDTGGHAEKLRASAETRLRRLGLDDSQIKEIAASGKTREYLTLYAPATGTILEKDVVAGSAVTAGERLFRIVDLSSVWIEARLYENEASLVKPNQPVRVSVPQLSGLSIEGTVSYMFPYLDEETRTGRIRVEVANPDGALKPGMYAEVALDFDLGEQLAVPEEAIVFAGKSHVAFIDLGEGRLQPRRVKIGRRAGDYIEILEGLKEGETVVTSANFLVAAESKLKSGIEKW